MSLYPEIEPYRTETLAVDDIHTVYFEECGNPKGLPAVFLHGGPGGGIEMTQRRFFDPKKYRIILIDQRGCGKSKPFAELRNNSTWELVHDIEKIRTHLDIEKWLVFGGSWGSTLALAYAIKHPEVVTNLVLRGIFLLRKSEIDWFYQAGCDMLYPDAFEDYVKPIPILERDDLVTAYYKRLTSQDAEVRLEAAKAWSVWEGRTSKLIPNADLEAKMGQDEFALAFARIECHYFVHKGFFPEDGWILKNIDRIRHIPATIVQGRYDVVCPVRSAWDLHRAWPEATLKIIPDSGHSATEPGPLKALIEATDRYHG
jgi:proline iminopeptidase